MLNTLTNVNSEHSIMKLSTFAKFTLITAALLLIPRRSSVGDDARNKDIDVNPSKKNKDEPNA